MSSEAKRRIRIQTDIQAPVSRVWRHWTDPTHVRRWNSAMEGWHTPYAESDLSVGGRFNYRMETVDGSIGFDYAGVYDAIRPETRIELTLDDGRKVSVDFSGNDERTHIDQEFEAENENPEDMQRAGWQNILDNFKTYTESTS